MDKKAEKSARRRRFVTITSSVIFTQASGQKRRRWVTDDGKNATKGSKEENLLAYGMSIYYNRTMLNTSIGKGMSYGKQRV